MTSTVQRAGAREQQPPKVLLALLLAAVALAVLGMHVPSVGHQLVTADHDPAAHHTGSLGAAVSAATAAAYHHESEVNAATGDGRSGPEGCLTCCSAGDMLVSGCLLALVLVTGWVLRLTRSGPTPPWLSSRTRRRPPRAVPVLGPQRLRQPAWTRQELCISRT